MTGSAGTVWRAGGLGDRASLRWLDELSFCDEPRCYELADWQLQRGGSRQLLCPKHALGAMRGPRRPAAPKGAFGR